MRPPYRCVTLYEGPRTGDRRLAVVKARYLCRRAEGDRIIVASALPAYELGWSRCSCAGCIFSSGEDLARLRQALPRQFARLAEAERELAASLEAAFPFLVEERARLKAELPTANPERARMIRGRLREISGVIGRTVVEGKDVIERADAALPSLPADFDRWRAYADGSEPWTADHMLRGPGAPVFNDPWTLPSGAVNPDSAGPPT